MKRVKTKATVYRLYLLVLGFSQIAVAAQSISDERTKSAGACAEQPLGLFRQVTGASLDLVNLADESFVVETASDRKNAIWAPSELDEVDPAYKFYFVRNRSVARHSRCGRPIDVTGKLISPTGKVFSFKKATYDPTTRKLLISTYERDAITYDIDMQFFATPIHVQKTFQHGTVRIRATGRSLGTVLIEAPFAGWDSE